MLSEAAIKLPYEFLYFFPFNDNKNDQMAWSFSQAASRGSGFSSTHTSLSRMIFPLHSSSPLLRVASTHICSSPITITSSLHVSSAETCLSFLLLFSPPLTYTFPARLLMIYPTSPSRFCISSSSHYLTFPPRLL